MKTRRAFLKLTAMGYVGLIGCGGKSPSGSDGLDGGQGADDADVGVSNGLAPVLTNFRVTDAAPTRVYFDSSEPIAGSTVQGFTISGATIEAIAINGNETTGHYFTVSSPFSFWDNNTIRYESGSDLVDSEGEPLLDFTLTYIENEIVEPTSSGTPYYVRTTGQDDNDGLSHESAFASVSRAIAVGATVVYVEVGTYVDEEVDVPYGGTPTDPVLIQGYKTLSAGVPDPISPNYWVYGEHGTFDEKTVDDTELPTFVGTNRERASVAWKVKGNTILRNVQVYNYNSGVICGGVSNVLVDNFVAVEIGGFGPSSSWKALYMVNANRVRLKNILMSEGRGAFVRTFGDHHLLDNVTYVGDQNHPDYQISLYAGSNNIVRNSLVHIVAGSGQHGFGVKASLVKSEYNLFDGNTSLCTGDGNTGVEWRHSDTRYTVVKNHLFDGGKVAFHSSNGTSHNIAENCIIRNMQSSAISIVEGVEDGSDTQSGGDYNLFRNLVIYDSLYLVYCGKSEASTSTTEATGNTFVNLTVHNVERTFSLPIQLNDTNEFINCSFSSIGDFASSHNDPAAKFTNCNWFGNGFGPPAGTSSTEHDPEFVDAIGGDFHLVPESQLGGVGTVTDLARYDFEGVQRPQAGYSIGAFES